MVAVPFMQGREMLSDTLNGPTYKRAPFKVENNMGTPSTYVCPRRSPPPKRAPEPARTSRRSASDNKKLAWLLPSPQD